MGAKAEVLVDFLRGVDQLLAVGLVEGHDIKRTKDSASISDCRRLLLCRFYCDLLVA